METSADRAERKARIRLQGISHGLGWFLQLLIIGFACAVPNVVKHTTMAELTFVTNNARRIGMGLEDFKKDYGRYPDATTAVEVGSRKAIDWDLADATSNDFFQQLFVSGSVSEERGFYAPQKHVHPPDERTCHRAEVLSAGECGFAYIPGTAASPIHSGRWRSLR